MFTGAMTWQELGAYLDHLPMESAYLTAIRDQYTDEQLAAFAEQSTDQRHGSWSHIEFLLARLIDAVNRVGHIQVLSAGVKDAEAPEPVSRPGVVPATSKRAPSAHVVAELSEIRARQARRRAESQAAAEGA